MAKLTDSDRAKAAEMLRDGYSRIAIGRRFGMTAAYIGKLFPQEVKRAQPAARRRKRVT